MVMQGHLLADRLGQYGMVNPAAETGRRGQEEIVRLVERRRSLRDEWHQRARPRGQRG
jgi:hypothetical protein